jgi:D-galactarolactone cycloisomerase
MPDVATQPLATAPLQLRALTAHVFRYPLRTPVVTSFGAMRDRPMVLVRAEDVDGAIGWGEVWCNFPAVGAEHRARLVESVLAPLVVAREFRDPPEAFDWMTLRTSILAIQSGEPGPFAQAIAGTDIALWDLAARRARIPLWRMLGGRSPDVRVYASGLDPERPVELAKHAHDRGFRAFKLKIGFDSSRDVANVHALRDALGADAELMVDANQAFDPGTAIGMAHRLETLGLRWFEEPLRADLPWPAWRALRDATSIPLAGGENIAGDAAFDAALAAGMLSVVQPDIGKWGGFTRNVPLARRVLGAGRRLCPHWLGGGIGLLASAHWLAAAGGDGMVEVDANANPLRTATCGALTDIRGGCARLTDAPGLGAPQDLEELAAYAVKL